MGKYTYDTIEKIKAKLKAIKLSDYPVESVQSMSIAIKAKHDQLGSTGYWGKDLFNVIAKEFKTAKCDKFAFRLSPASLKESISI
eukprot:3234365-Ditylum_brightwellii.AAC.2